MPQWSPLAGGGFEPRAGTSKVGKAERDLDGPNKTASTSKTSRSGTDKSIIFVGGKKAQASTKAPAAAAKAGTGELRHNQSNIRREEKK